MDGKPEILTPALERSPAVRIALLTALIAAAVSPARADVPYRVGPGDVIEIRVRGDESLTQTPTVQPTGRIALVGFGEVPAAERTVDEIRLELQRRMASAPGTAEVAVAVKEYRSQFVTVLGQVVRPGRVPLRGGTRLIDALVEAGGFTPDASLQLSISRFDGSFDDGAQNRQIQLQGAEETAHDRAALELPLQPGDVVVASTRTYYEIRGEVPRGGRYRIAPGLTLSQALEQAGGLTRYARREVEVHRMNAASGGRDVLTVDVDAVRRGSQPDPPVKPEDVIWVSSR